MGSRRNRRRLRYRTTTRANENSDIRRSVCGAAPYYEDTQALDPGRERYPKALKEIRTRSRWRYALQLKQVAGMIAERYGA